MKATLVQIVDPSLSIAELEAEASQAANRSWDASLEGKQTTGEHESITDEMNAYLFIAWLKKHGFTVAR